MTALHTTQRLSDSADVLRAVGSRWVLPGAAVVVGLMVAVLVDRGLWFGVIALAFAVPGFVLVHRAPLASLGVWLLVAPFVLQTGGSVRYAYQVVHRLLPVAILLALALSHVVGTRTRRLGRLGWPESFMAAYVAASVISVIYTSADVSASLIDLYDRVAIPMLLYVIVRLVGPDGSSIRRAAPLLAFLLVTQTVIGALSWAIPGILPSDWLGRVGSRTTGSLQSPSVYGVAVLTAGVLLLHLAATERRRSRRTAYVVLYAIALVMATVTFSRGVWLALGVVLLAAMVHRTLSRRVMVAALPILVVLGATGVIGGQIDTIQERFGSEETALDRLPLALASIDMFRAKPVAGWGFDNFDRFDRQFQREVAGFVPEKDHSSHNLYLTLLAEQGIVGLTFYLAPVVWWAVLSVRRWKRFPAGGRIVDRRLLIVLWGILGAHGMVNMFSNMRVVYGLGLWWMTLALIAVVVDDRAAGGRGSDALVSSVVGK